MFLFLNHALRFIKSKELLCFILQHLFSLWQLRLLRCCLSQSTRINVCINSYFTSVFWKETNKKHQKSTQINGQVNIYCRACLQKYFLRNVIDFVLGFFKHIFYSAKPYLYMVSWWIKPPSINIPYKQVYLWSRLHISGNFIVFNPLYFLSQSGDNTE